MTLIFLAIIWLGGIIVGMDDPLTDFIGNQVKEDHLIREEFIFVVFITITFIGDIRRMFR